MEKNDKHVFTIKDIEEELATLSENIMAYKKVDATLSEKTIFDTWCHLNWANKTLESGFVKDACDEVDAILALEAKQQCGS